MLNLRLIWILGAVLASGTAAQAGSPMQERTATIATRYLQVWSSNGAAAVESVRRAYMPAVTFYGQTFTHRQLIAEKRRAIQQWPLRRYVHRPGTMRVACSASIRRCTARSVMDFAVQNPARGAAKRGAARFALGIDFAGPNPRIFYEGGSLNNRRGSRRS